MARTSSLLAQTALIAFLMACPTFQAAELPLAVAASIPQISPTASPGEITPFDDAGETLFIVEVQVPGSPETREWHFDAQGVPVGVQVFEKELPAALREALLPHLNKKGAEVSDAVKIFEAGKALFEVEITFGKESKVLGFYSDGRPAYTETDLQSLPKPLRKSINHLTQTEGTFENILRVEGRARELYQISINRPKQPLWITLDASGAVLEREEVVDFKATPEAVQSAILTKAGSGDRVRVLLKRAGKTLEFEVHFFRDAKLHIFHLSQTGETQGPPIEPLNLP
jgi:hypothetical protein